MEMALLNSNSNTLPTGSSRLSQRKELWLHKDIWILL